MGKKENFNREESYQSRTSNTANPKQREEWETPFPSGEWGYPYDYPYGFGHDPFYETSFSGFPGGMEDAGASQQAPYYYSPPYYPPYPPYPPYYR
ncbi:hypothetical protein, partial [Paludifilum halophilum]